eukprot:TRINITY_DN2170_c0_g1_i1.p1 TRINITY_DN2170_c0_g1~~TRINITY_DN2170_c0_g1_i1.p1  ORF type:complete len:329 (+),score=98.51 TRINITY_DN2170_c0_g1_i1:83-1069(+)
MAAGHEELRQFIAQMEACVGAIRAAGAVDAAARLELNAAEVGVGDAMGLLDQLPPSEAKGVLERRVEALNREVATLLPDDEEEAAVEPPQPVASSDDALAPTAPPDAGPAGGVVAASPRQRQYEEARRELGLSRKKRATQAHDDRSKLKEAQLKMSYEMTQKIKAEARRLHDVVAEDDALIDRSSALVQSNLDEVDKQQKRLPGVGGAASLLGSILGSLTETVVLALYVGFAALVFLTILQVIVMFPSTRVVYVNVPSPAPVVPPPPPPPPPAALAPPPAAPAPPPHTNPAEAGPEDPVPAPAAPRGTARRPQRAPPPATHGTGYPTE